MHTSQGRTKPSVIYDDIDLHLTKLSQTNLGMWNRPVMLTISTSPVVGMVDGRGYDRATNCMHGFIRNIPEMAQLSRTHRVTRNTEVVNSYLYLRMRT